VDGALITELSVELSGTNLAAWVRFNQNVQGTRPPCIAPGWSNEFMFLPTTDLGRVFLAHLETAMTARARVDASGSGQCVDLNGGFKAEAVSYVKVYAN
jgi:hypothetical protein